MDKKRSTALALAVAVALGVAGLMWQDLFQGTPVAAQAKPAAKADTHKDGEAHQEGEEGHRKVRDMPRKRARSSSAPSRSRPPTFNWPRPPRAISAAC
ncbi:Cobalt/zinc/cadmium efflux RND transporter, membrane fusion protein, CzcB family [Pseudomonas chlororaphis subsp. aurantiaca]|nr:Cobalt/zinc/cadmium efflux RND transporter, membrane fusion protein, CzcB family [Pseudomonas chlororaphis subsp. aurantiaca]